MIPTDILDMLASRHATLTATRMGWRVYHNLDVLFIAAPNPHAAMLLAWRKTTNNCLRCYQRDQPLTATAWRDSAWCVLADAYEKHRVDTSAHTTTLEAFDIRIAQRDLTPHERQIPFLTIDTFLDGRWRDGPRAGRWPGIPAAK